MCPIHHMGKSSKRMNERLRFATYRVKCFLRLDRQPEQSIPGFGFTSDISETGIGIYINTKITVGANVRISLEDENSTFYPGVVAWCQRYKLEQKFHGHAALDHRVGLRFRFESEAEHQRYLMYFNDLRRRVNIFSKERLF